MPHAAIVLRHYSLKIVIVGGCDSGTGADRDEDGQAGREVPGRPRKAIPPERFRSWRYGPLEIKGTRARISAGRRRANGGPAGQALCAGYLESASHISSHGRRGERQRD